MRRALAWDVRSRTLSKVWSRAVDNVRQVDEARSMIGKTQSFQFILTKELLTASVSDPELMRILLGK